MKLVLISVILLCTIGLIGTLVGKKKAETVATSSISARPVKDVNPMKVRAIHLKQAVLNDDIETIKKILGSSKTSGKYIWMEAKGIGMTSSQIKPEIAKLLIEAGANPDDFKTGAKE